MKTNYLLFGLALAIWACNSPKTAENGKNEDGHADHEAATPDKKPSKSPRKAAMSMVAGNHVHIDYSSPSVRGRQVFGGLVSYDNVWVTGAHKATSIKFDKDVKIGETIVANGKYGFFTIPRKDQWTIILNSQWDMHLADDYVAAKDILRFDVIPETLDEIQESLTYEVVATTENNGSISMSWDKTKVSFEFKVQ